jgi:uncharacterized membrane protein YeiH
VLVATYSYDLEFGLITCAAITWALRAGSLVFGWRLPVYKARPPRV